MSLMETLADRWQHSDQPVLISGTQNLYFKDIQSADSSGALDDVRPGDVVALIGDFEPLSINLLLQLIDRKVILVPLTDATRSDHAYFFETALVDVVIEGNTAKRLDHGKSHPLIEQLRAAQHPGLVLFSTGTTGRPKAILHDMTRFLERFETPRPTLKALSFLLFDHIGGINTLLHMLFNGGTVIAPASRSVADVLAACRAHDVEVLPTTPTFLRMMMMSGLIPDQMPDSLKIMTYGTERMDQTTLDALCELLPETEFRQTYGMSELGILRVKSVARDSLFMLVGGEGVSWEVKDDILFIRSESRMLGYLNAPSPFDDNGWYNTHDLVEVMQHDKYGKCLKVVGRDSEIINVGGLKFTASEVETAALGYAGVKFAKAQGAANPITGQHVELSVEFAEDSDTDVRGLKQHLRAALPSHQRPMRISTSDIVIGHRFKRL